MLMIRRLLRSFRTLGPAGCLLVSCLLAAGPHRLVWAQPNAAKPAYTWDTIAPVFTDPKDVVAQKTAKDQVIHGRSSFSANRPLLDAWYRNYLFPSMATEALIGDIYDKRDMLKKDLETVEESALHQYLLDVAYDEATRRVVENYDPRVRVTAMLIIGDLNQTEKRVLAGVQYPAIRLPKALDFMVDEYKKPDQIDEIRLAAMIGILRHTNLVRYRAADQPIPDGRRAEIAALMKTLLDEKTPPAGRPADWHAWLRRRAADVLAALGNVGDNRNVFDSLVRIVGDAEEPLSVRCEAAWALGNLNYTDVTGIDALATVRQLGALAAFACRTEDTRAKEEQKSLEEELEQARSGGFTGMGGMGGMSGMGGSSSGRTGRRPGAGMAGSGGSGAGMGMGMPELNLPGTGGEGGAGPLGSGGSAGSSGGYPGMGTGRGASPRGEELDELVDRIRRRLKEPLRCVLVGVGARGPQQRSSAAGRAVQGAVSQLAADDQQKAEIAKIVAALDAIVKATDAHDDGLPEMLKQVRDETRKLEALLPNVVATPAKPAADDALPGAAAPAGAAEPSAASAPADASKPAK